MQQSLRALSATVCFSLWLAAGGVAAEPVRPMPTDQLIKLVEQREQARVINVQPIKPLSRYRLRLLSPDGRVSTVLVDQQGQPVAVEGRKKADAPAHR